MKKQIELWSNVRCNHHYFKDIAEELSVINCVKEKGHEGKHAFYVDWNDWT